MKKQFIFFALFFAFSQVFSQYVYERYDSAQVMVNGKNLKFPFVGGMNAPQFSEIDLNQDGIMDLLVFDRSAERVMTFINEGINDSVSYLYHPEYESTFPKANDFLLAADYNCDGKSDLFSRWNSIVTYQNTSTIAGGLSFSGRNRLMTDLNSFAGYPPNPTTIYVQGPNLPGIGDLDNDGDIDIIIPDGFGQTFNYHKNLSVENTSNCGLDFERRSKCWGDITESNLRATLYLDSCRWGDYPNSELSVKNLAFSKHTSSNKNGLKHGSASITLFDLDYNGSMDMLLGDDGTSRVSALFNDDSISPHTSSHIFSYDTLYPSYDQSVDLKNFPATYFLDVDNDSIKDMIVATNSTSRIPNEFSKSRNNIHFYKGTGNKNAPFAFQRTDFLNRDFLDFGLRSAPAFFDYNNDGLMDILVGNEGYIDSSGNPLGQLALLENTGTANIPSYQLIDEDFAQISSIPLNIGANKVSSGLIPALYDLDNDGDQDLILGDYYGRVHYFKDTSTSTQNAAFALEEVALGRINVYSEAAPTLGDVNADSLADLIVANGSGRLQLHLNLGSQIKPIFGLAVQSIVWQHDSTIRYNLRGNPDLSLLKVGQSIDVNDPINLSNGVTQTISAKNNTQKYIECSHPFRTDATDDEYNSTAYIDHSIKNWGGIFLGLNYIYNSAAVPFIQKNNNGDVYLLVATGDGEVRLYDSIANNLDGKFHLADTNYLGKSNIGRRLTISGGDFNNDGKIDLAVGNQNGGLNLFTAKFGVGLNDNQALNNQKQFNFSVYPNPTENHFTVELKEFVANSTIRIYNISGQLILEKKLNSQKSRFNASEFSNGFYMLEIRNESGVFTRKLIIQSP